MRSSIPLTLKRLAAAVAAAVLLGIGAAPAADAGKPRDGGSSVTVTDGETTGAGRKIK